MSRVSLIIVGSQASIAASLMAVARHNNIQVVGCVNDVADIFATLTDTETTIALIDFSVVSEVHYAGQSRTATVTVPPASATV